MTDLSEVYEGGRTVVNPQQRLLGMTIFAVGAVLVVGAIPIATTDLSSWFGLDLYGARQAAGVLAGLGVPAVFVGIFVVLPASNTTRAATAIGASLTVFGVALFSYAYPSRWLSNDPQFALGTIALYLAGALVTFWCLFVAVATFKTRDDPGGTARVEITEEGKIRVINPSDGGKPSLPGFGSVGLFGNDPNGTVPTQTNDDSQPTPAETDDSVVMAKPTSDGGAATAEDPAIEDEIAESAQTRRQPDTYCGNCAHFEYVSVDDEYVPYCGYHENVMEDMDACSEWRSNN
ncbi:DUF7139 domain-containing protein [Halovenus salina]|uniref:DUF7139 domain-containing protein n=1 Tax=Halovenus salina TaxID=1510225 RepID=UPI002260FBFB|nr:hypothetical protein [Halovenus salina]